MNIEYDDILHDCILQHVYIYNKITYLIIYMIRYILTNSESYTC